MRCRDLTGTWHELHEWFMANNVLVLPRLTGTGPTVRLDGDLAPDRPATAAEIAIVTERVRQIVERFAIPAVYVGKVADDLSGDASTVTVRVMAGGVLHELTLTSLWYVGQDFDLDRVPEPVRAQQSLASAAG
jgi:hypothetical protein